MTDFYSHGSYPAAGATGSSASMRSELDSIAAAFAKLYGYTGNSNYLIKVNSSGTGYTGSILVDDGTTVTVGGSLSVTGNTTLGDASGDTVTIKAATWTLTNSPTVTGTWANLGSVTKIGRAHV